MTKPVSPVAYKPDAPTIGVRVDPELKARIVAVAARDNRSLANWTMTAIMDKLARDEAAT